MYLTFVKKELLHTIRSYRYLIVMFLFMFMGITTTAVRTGLYSRAVADYGRTAPAHLRLYDSATNPEVRLALGVTVEKPPNPLAIFASGLDPEMTRSFSLSDWVVPKIGPRKLAAPSFQFLMPLDMVLIVNIICSLLAMLLVFDGICGEREQGTLKVLLAGPLPRDVIIVSKLVAGLVTIVAPLLITWGVSVAYAMFVGHVGFTADQLARLGLIIGLSIICICFYFALGIAVSSWVQRSATSLAICLFFWIVFVLAIPNLVPIMVNHFVPIPAQSKILKEKDAVYQYVTEEMLPEWRNEFGERSTFKTVEALMDSLYRKRDEEVARRTEGIDRFYSSLVMRQLRFNQSVSRLSPASSFLYAATQVAGTGAEDFIRLIGEVDSYQHDYDKVRVSLNDQMNKQNKPDVWFFANPFTFDPSVFPQFKPTSASLDAVANYCWVDVVLLLGGTVLLLLVSFVGFIRYDIK